MGSNSLTAMVKGCHVSDHLHWNHWTPAWAPQLHDPEASDQRVTSGSVGKASVAIMVVPFQWSMNVCYHSKSDWNSELRWTQCHILCGLQDKSIIRLRNVRPAGIASRTWLSWPINDSSCILVHAFFDQPFSVETCCLSFSWGMRITSSSCSIKFDA